MKKVFGILFFLFSTTAWALDCGPFTAADGTGYSVEINDQGALLMIGGGPGATGDVLHFTYLATDQNGDRTIRKYSADRELLQLELVQNGSHSDQIVILRKSRSQPIFEKSCGSGNPTATLNELIQENSRVRDSVRSIESSKDVVCELVPEMTQLNPRTQNFQAEYYCATREGGYAFGHISIEGSVIGTVPGSNARPTISVVRVNFGNAE